MTDHTKERRLRSVAVIPSRLESSRLPRKALADICGFPMIVHVYHRCKLAKSLDDVFVATDSDEVRSVIEKYGGKSIMTSVDHENGTERVAEAAKTIEADIVVNVQGDEVLVKPEHIDAAVNALIEDDTVNVAILVNEFSKRNSPSDIKAVIDEKNNVMYLSRSDIPSGARTKNPPLLKAYHILPFRKDFLMKYASWGRGFLEDIEFHEHLRILEKGYPIKAVKVDSSAISVDTKEDLRIARELMKKDSYWELVQNNLRMKY